MYKILFFAAAFLYPCAFLSAQVVDSTQAYNEVPEEIVIKSASEDKLRTAKPPLKIATDDLETIRKSLESDKDLFLFESGEFLSQSRNYPDKLFSTWVVQPWRSGFSDKTMISFNPLRKFSEVFPKASAGKSAREAQWTLSITDEEGKVFHRYSGSGLPPENISWTGENDRHEWLKAGHSYAPIYMFVDEKGTPKTVFGDLIKFTAIVFQKDTGLNISLDSVVLFGPAKDMKAVAKPEGEGLLASTADLIKRRYYNMPIRVSVYAQTMELAAAQAEQVKKFLGRALMTNESAITAEGVDESFAQQRVDVVITNK